MAAGRGNALRKGAVRIALIRGVSRRRGLVHGAWTSFGTAGILGAELQPVSRPTYVASLFRNAAVSHIAVLAYLPPRAFGGRLHGPAL